MRKLLTWRQVLAAAPIIGAVTGYAHFFMERLTPGPGGPAAVHVSIGLGIGVTVGALMMLSLVSYIQFDQPHGRRPRSWRR